MRRPDSNLKKWPAFIEQRRQPFTHRQPPQPALPLLPLLAAPPLKSFLLAEQLVGDFAK